MRKLFSKVALLALLLSQVLGTTALSVAPKVLAVTTEINCTTGNINIVEPLAGDVLAGTTENVQIARQDECADDVDILVGDGNGACAAQTYTALTTLSGTDPGETSTVFDTTAFTYVDASNVCLRFDTATTTGYSDFFVVDNLAPPAPAITSPATPVSASDADFAITGTAGADTPVDGVRTIRVLSGTTVVGETTLAAGQTDWSVVVPLTVGANNFTVTSSDASGNTSAATAVSTITRSGDTIAPFFSTVSPTTLQTTTTPTIAATYGDDTGVLAAAVVVRVDGTDVTGAAAPTATGFSFTSAALSDNADHTVYVYLEDAAGNNAETTYTFHINTAATDTTAPTIDVIFPTTVQTATTGFQIRATLADNVTAQSALTVLMRLNGVNKTMVFNGGTNRWEYNVTAGDGLTDNSTNTVFLRVTDAAGNFSETSWTFTISTNAADIFAPVITAVSPTTVQTSTTVALVVGYLDVGTSGIDTSKNRLYLDGLQVTPIVTAASMTFTATGLASPSNHVVSYEVYDLAGNSARGSFTFSVNVNATDTTPPLVGSVTVGGVAPTVVQTTTNPQIIINYSDGGSGVDTTRVRVRLNGVLLAADGGFPTANQYVRTNPGLSVGTNTLSYEIYDLAGNFATASFSVVVNTSSLATFTFNSLTPSTGGAVAVTNGVTVLNNSATTSLMVNYSATNTDANTVQYSINNGAWSAATTHAANPTNQTFTISPAAAVSVGTNTLQLRSSQVVNGETLVNTSAVLNFYVNPANGPSFTFNAGAGRATPGQAYPSGSITGVNYTIAGGPTGTSETVEFSLNGSPFAAVDTPASLGPVDDLFTPVDGVNTYQLRSTRTFANAPTEVYYSQTLTFYMNPVDGPDFTFTAPTPGQSFAFASAPTQVSYTITGGPAGTDQVEFSLNGSTFADDADDASPTPITAAVGSNTFQLKLTRTLTSNGLQQVYYSQVLNFYVNPDNAPNVSFTNPSPNEVFASTDDIDATWTFSAAPAGYTQGTVEYSLNGSDWAASTSATTQDDLDNADNEGTNTFQIRAVYTNPAGPSFTVYSQVLTYYVNLPGAPTVSFTNPSPNEVFASTDDIDATWTFSAAPAGYTQGTVEYSLNGSNWAATTTATSQDDIDDADNEGTNAFQIRAPYTSPDGPDFTVYSQVLTYYVNIPTAPTVTFTNPTPGEVFLATDDIDATWTFSATPAGYTQGTVEYSLNGSDWAATTSATSQDDIDDADIVGTNTFQIRAAYASPDGPDFTVYSQVLNYYVNPDNAPNVSFTNPSPNEVFASTDDIDASWVFTAAPAGYTQGAVEYSLNGSDWAPTTTAMTQDDLDDADNEGTNTFQIRAFYTSPSGPSLTSYSQVLTYYVNIPNAPTVSFTNPTAGEVFNESDDIDATWTFSAAPAGYTQGTVEYSLNGSDWATTTSATSQDDLDDADNEGTNTFQIRAAYASPDGPDFTVYSQVLNYYVNLANAPTVSFTNPSPNEVFTSLDDIDASWTFSAAPAGYTQGTVEYSLNGSDWATTTSATSQDDLDDADNEGTNTFQIRAAYTSPSGPSFTTYSQVLTYYVNLPIAPTVSFTNPSPNEVFTSLDDIDATWTFSAAPAGYTQGTVEYSLNGSDWATTTTATSQDDLDDADNEGTNTFQIRAAYASPDGPDFTVYSQMLSYYVNIPNAPTVSFTNPSPGEVFVTADDIDATWTFTAAPAGYTQGTVEYSLNGSDWAVTTTATTQDDLDDADIVGTNIFQIRAFYASPDGPDFTVYSQVLNYYVNPDNAPDVSFVNPSPNEVFASTDDIDASWTFSAAPAGYTQGTVEYSLNGSDWAATTSATTQDDLDDADNEGTNTFQIRAFYTSPSGPSLTTYSQVLTYYVNLPLAPTVSFTNPTPGELFLTSDDIDATWTFSAAPAGYTQDTVEYSLNGSDWAGATTATSQDDLDDIDIVGTNTFQIRAAYASPDGPDFTVYSQVLNYYVNPDNAPTVSFINPSPNEVFASTDDVDASWTFSAAPAGYTQGTVEYSLNGSDWAATTTTTTQDDLDSFDNEGTNTFQIRAFYTSPSGPSLTTYSQVLTYYVNLPTAPVVTFTTPTPGQVFASTTTINADWNFTATPAGYTQGTVEYSLNGSAWATTTTATTQNAISASDVIGTNTFQIRAAYSSATGPDFTTYSQVLTYYVNQANGPNFIFLPGPALNRAFPGQSYPEGFLVGARYAITGGPAGATNTVAFSLNGLPFLPVDSPNSLGTLIAPINDDFGILPLSRGTNTYQLRVTRTFANAPTQVYYGPVNTFYVNPADGPTFTFIGTTATSTPAPGTSYPVGQITDVSYDITGGPTGTLLTTNNVQYSLNGSPFADTATPASLTALQPITPVVGTNTFQLKVTRTFNDAPTQVYYSQVLTFYVNPDNAPDVSFTSPTPGQVFTSTDTYDGTWTFTATPAGYTQGTVQYSLNGTDWTDTTTATSLTDLYTLDNFGTNTFQIRAPYTSGSGPAFTAYSQVLTYYVNPPSAPVITFTTPTPGQVFSSTATYDGVWTFSPNPAGYSSGPNNVEYSLNGSDWAAASTTTTLTGLDALDLTGANTFQIRATYTGTGPDITTYSQVLHYYVNSANAPAISITSPTPNQVFPNATAAVNLNYTITGGPTGGTDTVTVSLNGDDFNIAGSSTTATLTPLVDGLNNAQVKIVRTFTNAPTRTYYSAVRLFFVQPADSTPPEFVFSVPVTGAVGVSVAAGNVQVTYDEPIQFVDETQVTINKVSDASSVKNGVATIVGNVLTIPYNALEYGTSYVVTVPTGAIEDLAGNDAFQVQIFFTTQFGTAPDITSLSVTNLTATAGTLNFSVNTTLPYTGMYRVGTTAYSGSWAPLTTAALTGTQALSALSPNTVYFYQVQFTKDNSTVFSVPLAFTTAAADTGIGVDLIQMIKTFATPDNTYVNGWAWRFNLSVFNPSETMLKLKFAQWASGANVLDAGSNMRYGLDLNNNGVLDGGDTIVDITTNATYPAAPIDISAIDTNPLLGGRQVTVLVEMKVPVGTPGGSYSTSYGIQTTP